MKKTTFILAYILTLILGLSAARGQGVTKDAKETTSIYLQILKPI